MAGSPLKRKRLELLRQTEPARAREKDALIVERLTDALLETLDAYREQIKGENFANANRLAVPLGVLADKQALRTGGPTSRNETADIDQLAGRLAEAFENAIPDPEQRGRVLALLPQPLEDHGKNGATPARG